MTVLLKGDVVQKAVNEGSARRCVELAARGVQPRLAIVHATEDPGAEWYVRAVSRAAEKVGVAVDVLRHDPASDEKALRAAVQDVVSEGRADAVVLSAPLPDGVHGSRLAEDIPVGMDVDGVSPQSLGRLACGMPSFVATTAAAVMEMLRHYEIELSGRTVAVVGRSTVVGRPLGQLLLARDATVIACHSRTRDLAGTTRQADVVVAAAGRPGLITAEHVREGAVVVDVGTTPDSDGKLQGDVDFDAVEPVASAISPVPGGVGPVTTALLIANVVSAAEQRDRG